jgi:hypothetical protein
MTFPRRMVLGLFWHLIPCLNTAYFSPFTQKTIRATPNGQRKKHKKAPSALPTKKEKTQSLTIY